MRYWHFNLAPHEIKMTCEQGATLFYFPNNHRLLLEYVLTCLLDVLEGEDREGINRLYDLIRVSHDKGEEH